MHFITVPSVETHWKTFHPCRGFVQVDSGWTHEHKQTLWRREYIAGFVIPIRTAVIRFLIFFQPSHLHFYILNRIQNLLRVPICVKMYTKFQWFCVNLRRLWSPFPLIRSVVHTNLPHVRDVRARASDGTRVRFRLRRLERMGGENGAFRGPADAIDQVLREA